MTKTVSAYEARTRLGELINLVYYKGDEVIVEKMGKPMVKITQVDKKQKQQKKTSDFSEFSGKWTEKEAEEFDKIIEEAFEQINPEGWK